MSDVAILGAGAFGTALAIALGSKSSVQLWSRHAKHARAMTDSRENTVHLPGAKLPQGVQATADLSSVSAGCVLLAIPTQQLSEFVIQHRTQLNGRQLVLCCKGIDQKTGRRPSELVSLACPTSSIAVLTGPSFAADIAMGLPTALTLATGDDGAALQKRLSTATLRPYLTDDVIGAELGGALKNIIALAAGLTIGAGLADSARAAVVTRGFAEISRFAGAFGARAETLAGLSGLGDLILTCTSDKSRNFAAGVGLAKGKPLPTGQTIEGVATARAVADTAKDLAIDMPLTSTVCAVTDGVLSVTDAAAALMSRPLKKE